MWQEVKSIFQQRAESFIAMRVTYAGLQLDYAPGTPCSGQFAALKCSPLKMPLRPNDNTPFSYLTARNQLWVKIELKWPF